MERQDRPNGASQGTAAPERPDLPGIRRLGSVDLVPFTRTHLLRAQGPKSQAGHLSVMRLTRHTTSGGAEARLRTPEPESFHQVTEASLTGGLIFEASAGGEIKA